MAWLDPLRPFGKRWDRTLPRCPSVPTQGVVSHGTSPVNTDVAALCLGTRSCEVPVMTALVTGKRETDGQTEHLPRPPCCQDALG